MAILIAFVRIRERRAQRFALLLIALVFGGSYMWWTATPYPEVNAVERVHFVEYGLIAFLFYRAGLPRRSLGEGGRSAGDPSIVILPMLAAFTVGTFDEWLQWFIPFRVGEAHDVFINLAAIVCGLLFCAGAAAAGGVFIAAARGVLAPYRRDVGDRLGDLRGLRQPGASRPHRRDRGASAASSRITPNRN